MSWVDRTSPASVRAPTPATAPRVVPVGVPKPAAPTPLRTRWMLAAAALCLLWPFPSFEQINNPNENVRFYMTAALVEDGSYQIDTPWRRWGWVNDAAELEGRHYSVKAPLTSWLGVPAYALYRAACESTGHAFDRLEALWLCRLSAAALPFWLFLWALYGWLGRRTSSPVLRDATWLSVAFGSLLYGYALIFVSHTLAAACGFGALMLLARRAGTPGKELRDAAAAGLLAAGVTAAEYPGVLVSALLTLLAAVVLPSWRARVAYAAGAAVPTLGVMHFQWRAFGDPFKPGHLYLENKAFAAIHAQGVFGADRFHPEAAGALLFDPGFGLFPLTPLLLPGLAGVWLLLLRRRPAGRAVAVTCAAIALAAWLETSLLSNWRGGWTIGPRYLATIVPFVAWAALEAMEWAFQRLPRATEGFAIGATAVGLLASGWPSAFYPHLPESIVRPLPQLMLPIWDGGYAPRSVGSWLGVAGLEGMVPWLLALVGLLLATLTAASWPTLPMPTARKLLLAGPLWSRRLGGGAVAFAVLIAPLADVPQGSDEARARRDVAFILDHWSPPRPAPVTPAPDPSAVRGALAPRAGRPGRPPTSLPLAATPADR